MYHDFLGVWKKALRQGLKDDQADLDFTTQGALGGKNPEVRARVVAKARGVWAADPLVAALAAEPAGIRVKSKVRDGDRLTAGSVVVEWQGPAAAVLAYERPFLNLASYVCGIATATQELVDIARKACPKRTPRVTSTRKILPAYRDLALHGVRSGGGVPHRVSLASGVLIKENHIAAAGSIRTAIEGARAVAPHGLRIEIEVRNAKELDQALECGADIVMLDNFKVADVRSAIQRVNGRTPRPILEVSGGLNARTLADYAIEGVDILSVGGLTHSVTALDLSLLIGDLR